MKRFSVLSELTEAERELLVELLEERELQAGEALFLEGEESDGLVLVESGALRLTSERAGTLGLVSAGGSIGGMALVSVGQRELSAVAEEASHVRLLSRSAFRRLVEDAPRVGCRILETCVVEFAGVVRECLDRMKFRA
ncbi:MAG: cyclic nucleotide-binding domain-containing protein [Myxococcales bacterium]|nr:cyclic nucleotide-binding domain-containing protein [Myxococcales bacterium]